MVRGKSVRFLPFHFNITDYLQFFSVGDVPTENRATLCCSRFLSMLVENPITEVVSRNIRPTRSPVDVFMR
ncbi:unnamed protein product [Timema podura]|uniref:Uncharacterized protein n=1 Tax=Timema podura TaxID=61482 RepID=A0ABN7PCM4_TIMPD|nr:unnamed protein product [Timema podura]